MINRYFRQILPVVAIALIAVGITLLSKREGIAQSEADNQKISAPLSAKTKDPDNAKRAWQKINGSIARLVETGPAFQASLRQVTRVEGQQTIAVGRYMRSSESRGLMRMELQSPIGDQTSLFEQTCDGRLVWTRQQVGDDVTIRRVDIGRLDEVASATDISARFRVGGLPELLDSIAWDFDLSLSWGKLPDKIDKPLWLIKGKLKQERIDALLTETNQTVLPPEMPSRVQVVLETSEPFQLMPIRIEFSNGQQPISALDLYDIEQIDSPSEEMFRYNTSEEDAHFTNETQFYLNRFRTRVATSAQWKLLVR